MGYGMFIGIEKLEKLPGKPEKVLGKIPSYEELTSEVRRVVEEAKKKGVKPGTSCLARRKNNVRLTRTYKYGNHLALWSGYEASEIRSRAMCRL